MSITFFHENEKPLPPIGDIVYPITEDEDTIFKTSINCHFKKITKYYDSETREFKNQSKISFIVRIISPKLPKIDVWNRVSKIQMKRWLKTILSTKTTRKLKKKCKLKIGNLIIILRHPYRLLVNLLSNFLKCRKILKIREK